MRLFCGGHLFEGGEGTLIEKEKGEAWYGREDMRRCLTGVLESEGL